jgi:hypothetical protein
MCGAERSGESESEGTNFSQFCCDADADCGRGGMGKGEHNNASSQPCMASSGLGWGCMKTQEATRREGTSCEWTRGGSHFSSVQSSGRCFGRVRQCQKGELANPMASHQRNETLID